MTGGYTLLVPESSVSFVARTVVAPFGVPSGAGHVKETAKAVASQGIPPPTGRLLAVTVYVTVVPLGTTGSGGVRLIWRSRAF
jgi:hypothetical protein